MSEAGREAGRDATMPDGAAPHDARGAGDSDGSGGSRAPMEASDPTAGGASLVDRTIADLRVTYARATLDVPDVDPDPVAQFRRWFDEAVAGRVPEPNAMTLATASADGAPDARTVLLKGVDGRGLSFYTDYRSAKGRQLDANPRATLVFWWAELERQVRVSGRVERVAREESAAYYATRPRGSRLGAWTSRQSSVIPDRAALERELAEVELRFADQEEIPLPEHWGGYRVVPYAFEFWQGRPSRLHDRIRYVPDDGAPGGWRRERLSP